MLEMAYLVSFLFHFITLQSRILYVNWHCIAYYLVAHCLLRLNYEEKSCQSGN